MSIHQPPSAGTALWVHAHPRPGSFNDRLFRAGTEALSGTHEVLTSDLYAQGFDPVLGEGDVGDLAGDVGSISEQAGIAYANGQTPPDVLAEQAKLTRAELLVLQFPLWWYGPPAILKGWFDRVLTSGFAYGDMDPELGVPRRYGDGGLAGRRALVVVTAGDDDRSIGSRGISGDIDSLLFPITHGVLWYTGIESFELHVVHDADGLTAEGVEEQVERLRTRVEGLPDEEPRTFRSLRDGDYRGSRALRDDLAPGRTDLQIHLADGTWSAGSTDHAAGGSAHLCTTLWIVTSMSFRRSGRRYAQVCTDLWTNHTGVIHVCGDHPSSGPSTPVMSVRICT